MPEVMTERIMLDRLSRRFAEPSQAGQRWYSAEHVPIGVGFDRSRILDFMAFDMWNGHGATRGPKLHGVEVKISRADWLREVKAPEKAEAFARYCEFFWLCIADVKMVRPGELPEGWGLLVPYGAGLKAVEQPVYRKAEELPRALTAALVRAASNTTVRRVTR